MSDAERLGEGDTAPYFSLEDETGSQVALTDLQGDKVVLFFYPEAMTPGCTTEACDFRDNLNSLRSAGYRVIGISRDAPPKNAKFKEQEGLNFPLLSDPDLAAHKAYGAWGEKSLYGKTVIGVIRSTFVLDEAGVVKLPMYNVKATGHVASLRKKLGVD